MKCIYRFIIVAAASTVIMTAASAERINRTPTELFKGRLDRAQDSTSRSVMMLDRYDVECPKFSALISSGLTGGGLYFFLPVFAMEGIGWSWQESDEKNAREIGFQNEQCRYRLTIKQFDLVGDQEVQAPMFKRAPLDPILGLSESPKPESLVASPTARADSSSGNSPLSVRNDKIILDWKRMDPHQGGFTTMGAAFESTHAMPFVGMLYFARHSFTVYLQNVPDDYEILRDDNHDIKAYEISFKSKDTRIYMAVSEEVLLEQGWTKVFNEDASSDLPRR